MRLLFKAKTKGEEIDRSNMVNATLHTLRFDLPPYGVGIIELQGRDAIVIADLVDLGTAPLVLPLTVTMRRNTALNGVARIGITEPLGVVLADHIEVGLIRHQAGCDDPKKFTLH
jgi:hypothetical protein